MVGERLGEAEGKEVGESVVGIVGIPDNSEGSFFVEEKVGLALSECVGLAVGSELGIKLGEWDGGVIDGDTLELMVGVLLGDCVMSMVGSSVGSTIGIGDGT